MRLIGVILACVGAALLLASSATASVAETATTAENSNKTTSLPDAIQETAEERHMSVSELEAQLAWENKFAILTTEIAAAYPEDYAGAAIVDGAPTIRFSANVPASVKATVSEMEPSIQIVENLGWNETEIVEAGEAAHYAVRDATKTQVATDIDAATGTITVYVPEKEEIALSAIKLLHSTTSPSGASFEVNVKADPSLETGDDAIYGGGDLTSCTAGFSVKKSGYANAIITADHCPNSQSFGSTTLSYRGGSSTRDVQWHSSSTYAAPEIHWGFNGVHQVTGYANPVVGQTLYREGKTTGYTSDITYKANQCRNSYCGMMTMNNRKADGGDSGGPWFVSGTAYGVHSGYVTIWFEARDMFTPISSGLSTLGLSLKQ